MSRNRLIPAYFGLVGVPFLALFLVLKAGAGLTAPAVGSARAVIVNAPPAAMNLFLLVLQVAVILLASRLVGMLFKKIKQPQVIGEMVAGILLGPSLLGWVAPAVSTALFPASSLGYLNALSQIGLVFFMFLVGIALNPRELREHGRAAVLTSHASIVMPFCLGSALALLLYPRLASPGISFMSYALFMGSAMSITAFPVLARILTERNLLRSRMGTLSISCAAVDDITGWCILAYIVVLIRSESSSRPLWITIGGAVTFVLVMLFVVKRSHDAALPAGHVRRGEARPSRDAEDRQGGSERGGEGSRPAAPRQSQQQVSRLERVFEIVGKRPRGKTCRAMEGLSDEVDEAIEDGEKGPVLDAALIASAQAVEHYEIARYGAMIAWARQAGLEEAAELLGETLEEEKQSDQRLNEIALRSANQEAEELGEEAEAKRRRRRGAAGLRLRARRRQSRRHAARRRSRRRAGVRRGSRHLSPTLSRQRERVALCPGRGVVLRSPFRGWECFMDDAGDRADAPQAGRR